MIIIYDHETHGFTLSLQLQFLKETIPLPTVWYVNTLRSAGIQEEK